MSAQTFAYVFLASIVIFIGYMISLYNRLVAGRNQVANGWSQIDVQLKRRHDLIPNLVETVKGAAAHEKETLESVINARNAATSAQNVNDRSAAENKLSSALANVFALSEAYPQLQANENFAKLQEEITTTENKIGFARQSYNDQVLGQNNQVQQFPSNILAGMFNFGLEQSFELDPSEAAAAKSPPKVGF